jgi:hypothetical protein
MVTGPINRLESMFGILAVRWNTWRDKRLFAVYEHDRNVSCQRGSWSDRALSVSPINKQKLLQCIRSWLKQNLQESCTSWDLIYKKYVQLVSRAAWWLPAILVRSPHERDPARKKGHLMCRSRSSVVSVNKRYHMLWKRLFRTWGPGRQDSLSSGL